MRAPVMIGAELRVGRMEALPTPAPRVWGLDLWALGKPVCLPSNRRRRGGPALIQGIALGGAIPFHLGAGVGHLLGLFPWPWALPPWSLPSCSWGARAVEARRGLFLHEPEPEAVVRQRRRPRPAGGYVVLDAVQAFPCPDRIPFHANCPRGIICPDYHGERGGGNPRRPPSGRAHTSNPMATTTGIYSSEPIDSP